MIIEILPKITALAIIAPPKRTMVFRALKTALSCLELGLSVASKRSSSSLSSKILLKVEPPPETRKGKIQLQCNWNFYWSAYSVVSINPKRSGLFCQLRSRGDWQIISGLASKLNYTFDHWSKMHLNFYSHCAKKFSRGKFSLCHF